jgi:hypothetical protein
MKALVFWSNGIKIGEIQKINLNTAIEKGYRQPELIYEVIDTVDCEKNELDYKQVLGTEFNYICDSVGTTWYDESYVCPITEEQYNQLMNLLNKHKEEKEELIFKANEELAEQKEKEQEELQSINKNFIKKTFQIDNKTTLEITGLENLNNKVQVKIKNDEDIATLLYGSNKVYLDFSNNSIIEITRMQDLINFLWNTFGYRGNAELYKYTTEYKINYCE